MNVLYTTSTTSSISLRTARARSELVRRRWWNEVYISLDAGQCTCTRREGERGGGREKGGREGRREGMREGREEWRRYSH